MRYRDYRVGFWHDHTKTLGSGAGGGVAFEHEWINGWAPFGRLAVATNTGTLTKQADSLGLAQVHPFGRRSDMFGVAFNYTVPTAKEGLAVGGYVGTPEKFPVGVGAGAYINISTMGACNHR